MAYFIGPILFSLAFGIADDPMVIVKARQVKVKQNRESNVVLRVTVKDGFHVQAARVTNDLIPTTIHVKSLDGVTFLSPELPPSKKFSLEGTDDFLDVYDGRFEIRIPVRVSDVSKGRYSLEGELRYQACDARRCFFPRTVPFAVELVIL